ncbi:MAG: hypothetical protein LBC03_05965 [Nitrososphaerota archaeon]|jgi:hypothetical protein|nr:hypothetical protein [Nitrososphaerota archaeon]
MTIESELKEIKTILSELSKTVEGINALIVERLIRSVESLPDEFEAAKEYQTAKKNNNVELIPWKDPK